MAAAATTTTMMSIVSSQFFSLVQLPKQFSGRSYVFASRTGFCITQHNHTLFSLKSLKYHHPICATVLSGTQDIGVSSAQSDEMSITAPTFRATMSGSDDVELKIRVEVPGEKTQAIFDDVFDKMVVVAQPIPGFRRVKGGKTPNIPRDVLIEVLGPSKVYKQVIKKVISSTVAEYVEKEFLKVSKNLRVEQSFEDLEDSFEPGEAFSFDAVVHLLK